MSKFRNNDSVSQILIHSETHTMWATRVQSFAQMTATTLLCREQKTTFDSFPKPFKPQAEMQISFSQTSAIKSFLQVVKTANSINIF